MSMNNFTEGIVNIHDINLHYRDWGGQGQTVLLLHGLASHSGIWDLVGPMLSHNNQVIAIDQRGHGQSSKPNDGYDFQTVTRDVYQFINKIGLHSPVIVGHSWGGNVALNFAATYPNNTSGIIMVDGGFIEPSSHPGWNWEKAKTELTPPDWKQTTLEQLRKRIRTGTLSPYLTSTIESIIIRNFYVNKLGFIRPHLSFKNHMKIVRSLWEHHPSRLYKNVKCSALVVAAYNSITKGPLSDTKIAWVKNAVDLLPKGNVIWLNETIHDVPLQRPQTLTNEINKFILSL